MRQFHEILISNLSISGEEIIEWVAENYNPEDVFTTQRLDEWALDNGYTKTEQL